MVLLLVVAGLSSAQGLSALDELESGWNIIPTDGVCSAGTPYQFYAHPNNLTIAQYNTAEDEVQISFTAVIGEMPGTYSLPVRIFNHYVHYVEIESAVDDFYHYTAGGAVHTIFRSSIFYTYVVEGVSFVDWVTTLINEGAVEDVSCADERAGCSVAPDAES